MVRKGLARAAGVGMAMALCAHAAAQTAGADTLSMRQRADTDTLLIMCREASARPTLHVWLSGHVGWVVRNDPFLRGANAMGRPLRAAGHLQGGVSWRGGSRPWQRAWRDPTWGAGVGTVWMGDRFEREEELGQPVALFGFIGAPVVVQGQHQLRYRLELGAAMGWKAYDARSNPRNTMIGTPVTLHVGLGVEWQVRFDNGWTTALGVALTHYSNGCLRKPNVGINIVSPTVRLQRQVGRRRVAAPAGLDADPGESTGERPRTKGSGSVQLMVGYAHKRYDHNTALHKEIPSKYFGGGALYHVATLRLQYMRRYSPLASWGAGLSVVYDEMQGADEQAEREDGVVRRVRVVPGPVAKRFNAGVMVSHELLFGPIGAVADLGFDALRPAGVDVYYRKLRFFQRLGVRGHLPAGLLAYMGIQAYHFTRADFLEWSIGYEFARRKGARRTIN